MSISKRPWTVVDHMAQKEDSTSWARNGACEKASVERARTMRLNVGTGDKNSTSATAMPSAPKTTDSSICCRRRAGDENRARAENKVPSHSIFTENFLGEFGEIHSEVPYPGTRYTR